jgi:probable rRNA maturation factor
LPFGELVIATDQALRQAKRLHHSFAVEARCLLIHGYLHLIGYDHQAPGERREMRSWEDKINRRLRRTARL